jgi:hypothetical protein
MVRLTSRSTWCFRCYQLVGSVVGTCVKKKNLGEKERKKNIPTVCVFEVVLPLSGLLVNVWFVFIVLPLEVTTWIVSMLHVFLSIIYGKEVKCLEVTHEPSHLTLFPSTSVTRQCAGTLSTHHCALSWRFAD